jgi:hypothetical protein
MMMTTTAALRRGERGMGRTGLCLIKRYERMGIWSSSGGVKTDERR